MEGQLMGSIAYPRRVPRIGAPSVASYPAHEFFLPLSVYLSGNFSFMKLSVHAKKKNSRAEPILRPEIVKEVASVVDEEDDLLDDDFEDEGFEGEENVDFEDEFLEDDTELHVGDGAGGGGISLAGTWWDKEALALAEEVCQSFDGDLGIYAFKTMPNSTIQVRIEKLSNKSGSPNMEDIQAFSLSYRTRLDEAEVAKSVPENLSLEVSSPGVERVVRVPYDFERFKERAMSVKYIGETSEGGSSSENDGIFRLVSFDVEARSCTWGLADVRVNREKAGKGRPLSKKQPDRLFHDLPDRNVVAYNTLIKCYVGKSLGAPLSTYSQMRASMVAPNSFTFTFLLLCLEAFKALQEGRMIHGEILKSGNGSCVFVQNTLLSFYSRCCEDLVHASQMFEEMQQRDIVSWNSMVNAYMARGLVESALALFDSMPWRNNVTWNTMISGLSKAGKMELASSIFDNMPEKNDISWNCMISGFVRIRELEAAMSMFTKMPEKTVVSWTAMISGYTIIGDLKSAEALFRRMPLKNTVSWNAMMAGYVHNHQFDKALSVFHRMLGDKTCEPNQATLISALSACSHLGSLEQGKWIDSYIKKNNLELSLPLGNALIDVYARCGDLENARLAFENMTTRCVITWTTMVSGLAYNGECVEAVALYDRMCSEGLRPDDVLFIAVLTACTHGGLVEEGKRVFSQMVNKFGIEPRIEHYGSMVDLLGRVGKLDEAIEFIEKMHLQPNSVIWATLLSSCKIHGNKDIPGTIIQKIMEQEPSNPSYLTLISSMEVLLGQNEEGSIYRAAMRDKGMEKVPGCSLIQVGNRVYEFVARDTDHEHRREIYTALCHLHGCLKSLHGDMGEQGIPEV